MSLSSSTESRKPLSWSQVYLGVALTALATLVLELSLTRIFSVVFHYHFAFLAISMALFGLGAGGLMSYSFRGRGPRLFWKLGWLAALNSVCVLGSLAFVLTRSGAFSSGTLALIYLTSALPFFLAGCVVSTAIAETVERVNRVYFFDLLGAAAGCMLLVPLLDFVGAPNTVIGAAILYASSAAIWYTLAGSMRGRAAAVVMALALAGLVVINARWPLIDVRYAKGEELAGELFVKWNSFSRVAVMPNNGGGMSIRIDADAASGMASFDFDRLSDEERRFLLEQGPALPYALRPGAKTLILEPGGGLDIARALASGSADITGVEQNPIIANTVMRDRFAEESRRLYYRPEVRIVVGDGRSFARSSREQFQVLQATLMERWSSALAGTLALAENHLLTTEAFVDYLERLTADGVMAFSQWGVEPPRESLRLVSLARESLERTGAHEPWRHIIAVRERVNGREGSCRDTILVARRPLSQTDLTRAQSFLEVSKVEVLYLPGQVESSPYSDVLRNGNLPGYPYDISPVDDNRPFFSYTAPPGAFWELLTNPLKLSDVAGDDDAVPLLFRLLGIGVLATAIVLMLPVVLLRSHLPREPRVWRFLPYFVFIGAGYILIQVALIQKFVLFLGHPTYALTVIVFSMLVSSGLGSYYSQRIAAASDSSLMGVLAVAALLVASLAVLISPLVAFGAGWPMEVKVIITVLLLAPAGFVMGIPFPAGLIRLEAQHHPTVRWAWSLNASASVLGSAAAMVLAIHLGLRETLLVGGVMYLCALISVEASAARRNRRLAKA